MEPPAEHEWQFIVAWYDGSNLYIQVDDNPVDTLAYTGGIYDGNSMFLVGGDPYDGQRFDGAIDEVALYKRVLSDEERAWLYNAGAGRSYAELLGEPPASEGWLQRGYAYEGQQPHAVTSVSHSGGTDTYEYDQNGNMTCRAEEGVTYQQTYNAENRIASIRELAEGDCETPLRIAMQWDYAYDGDGARTATLTTPYDENGNPQTASLTTYYFGGAYEVTDGAVKKYYAFGGGTVAMRDSNGLQYFLTDHLGSVLAVTDASGTLTSEQRYLPFGEVRTDVGEITQTDFGYTFQRSLPGTGLMDYRARFYAPALGRFIQPDSIVPGTENPQAWNRYSYTLNNSLSYTDPDGHVSIPIILLAAVKAIFTVVDWGWTGYDTITYIQTAVDPNNSPEVQKEAWGNAVITVGMELIEPDEALSPIALPVDDVIRHGDEIGDGLIRLVRQDQVGTSQPFKPRKGEDGLSVFEGVASDEVLEAFPGNQVPNTTVTIPTDKLPPGTQIIPKLDPNLSQRLSEAHRILVRPEGWSVDRFAKALKALLGWE